MSDPPKERVDDSLRGQLREMLFYEGWEMEQKEFLVSGSLLHHAFRVLIELLGDEREGPNTKEEPE